MTGTSEFWKAIKSAKPRVLQEIVYRAYYDNTGILSARSGPESDDWPEGKSIDISAELYKDTSKLYRCKVINGKLVEVKAQDPGQLQLEKADDGKFTSLKNNIIFVAKKGDNYKQKEYNEEIK